MSDLFQTFPLAEGADLHVATPGKFKNVAVAAFLLQDLKKETVTPTALLSEVLGRGTQSYPDQKSISRRLEELYGADLATGVHKLGEIQSLFVQMQLPEERFLPEGGMFEEGLKVMREVLLDPVTEEGAFRGDYVDQERENLRRRIESLINDKVRYASMRCIQEMFPDEPYGLHPLGRVEDLGAITPESLYATYREILRKAPIDIFVVGGDDKEKLAETVARVFRLEGAGGKQRPAGLRPAEGRGEARTVVEEQPVQQGKLCLGYRTGVTFNDPQYYPMLFYNGILGGFVHSKLFKNVREKASLAYYANSRHDPLKGVLLISSGIEVSNYERALEIIREQVDAMAAGRISDEEMEFTRKALKNSLRMGQDSPGAQILQALERTLGGRRDSLEERLAAVDRVTRDEVVQVADRVRLDTIYFLKGVGENGGSR